MECWNCHQRGHRKAECPSIRCFRCGNMGHMARECTGGRQGQQRSRPRSGSVSSPIPLPLSQTMSRCRSMHSAAVPQLSTSWQQQDSDLTRSTSKQVSLFPFSFLCFVLTTQFQSLRIKCTKTGAAARYINQLGLYEIYTKRANLCT